MKNFFCLPALIALFFSVFVGCTSDDNSKPLPNERVRVLIANQGLYSKGTASLSAVMYDGSVQNDLFSRANERTLGDVAQALTVIDDKIFVSLNNSNKIEVMSKTDYKSLGTILFDAAVSPHYIVQISDHEAAVSNLMSSVVYIIDTKTFQITGTIKIKGRSSKQMIVAENKLFVAAGSQIDVIDLFTRQWTATIEKNAMATADTKLVLDNAGKVWALSSNGLSCINPTDNKVEKVLALPKGMNLSSFGARLDISPSKDTLYFNAYLGDGEGIVAVPVNADVIPSTLIFDYKASITQLYCMSVSPQGTIFIADAVDYSAQRGYIYELDLTGKELNKQKVGIYPGYIYFVNE